MDKLQKFFFTFGYGHGMDGFYQPVEAYSYTEAANLMFRFFNDQWAFGYTEVQFEQAKERGFFTKHEALQVIKVEESVQ